MKTGISCSIVVLMTGLLLASAPQTRGDAVVSWDYDTGFVPPGAVVIGPNDTVTWTNADLNGLDIVLSIQGFEPFTLTNFTSKAFVFPSAGTNAFTTDFGDHGVVIVNIAPSVTITYPTSTTFLPSPATFTIQAAASDQPDESGLEVEFFLNGTQSTNSIGVAFGPPYSASITNLVTGTYTLIAIATDFWGWTATNSVTITVGGVSTPIQLSIPRISSGQFLFDVAGLTVGRTNIVETSTNLTAWTPIMTNVAASASATMTNTPAPGPHFYRVIELPGPGGGSVPIYVSLPRISSGQILFDVAGLTVGKTNIVQTSTNLTAWTPIMTNVAASASATITNSPAPGPHFYRVMQLP